MDNKDSNHVERELKKLPAHKLSQSNKKEMHHQLMETVGKHEEKERRGEKMKKFTVGIASVAVAGLFVFLGVTTINPDPNQQDQVTEQQEIDEFNKETAREVMEKYRESFATLVEAGNDDGLITTFESKEEVKSHFTEVMSEDLASWMVDSYVNEEDGNLYVVAKDSPTWLAEDTDFQIEEVSNDHYKIIQERDNELLGHVEMIFHSEWQEGKWILSEIESTQLEQQVSIEQQAQTILHTIDQGNMKGLAQHVHPEKGLLFSPYVNVEDDSLVFQKNEISSLLDEEQPYVWGQQDGNGRDIELTPSEYFDQILFEKPFQNPDEINVDQLEQRGTTKNNIDEAFPQSRVVEFYVAGSGESADMNWGSLYVVFEQDENEVWKVVALVNDKWTI
ncbi:YSIRK-type signal peptide-containing protein [Halobacillus seohaensis]|uniref:YSIRK-type signal peptide-containing protein n=1 Tax=Halobacillus seohaensis TaxID=447421 RepID=A0ABW2ENE5_9BACI